MTRTRVEMRRKRRKRRGGRGVDKGEEDDDDYQKEKETTNDRKHNGYTLYDNIIISFIVVSRLFVFKSHAVSSAYYLEYRTARIPVNDILYDPAVIYFCWLDGIDLNEYPVLMNGCDNTAACAWVTHKCKTSLTGRALGRLFCGFLMSTKIGIQAQWLSTHKNTIADAISRLKKEGGGEYDYERLLTDFACLRQCRQFKPSDTLRGMISATLRTGVSPDPLMLRKLEPRELGSVTTSTS